jgi:DNA mismatch endonuclease, patch repair protein
MTDVMTKEQRRKNMQAIKSISKLEEQVSKKLWSKGIRFRKNTKNLFGKPDLSIKKYKVVIFIDSCFWHCCPLHGTMPKTNPEFWKEKLSRNQKRDETVNRFYLEKGWKIKRIWEHEIKNDIDKVVKDIIIFIDEAKKT